MTYTPQEHPRFQIGMKTTCLESLSQGPGAGFDMRQATQTLASPYMSPALLEVGQVGARGQLARMQLSTALNTRVT